MKNNKYIKGFTLAELAIVIAVIAILIIFVVPNLGKIAENSEGSSALSKAKDLYAQYVIDNSKEGFIDDELYVEVEDGYVHYLNGDPVKNGETYLVNQIFINDDVLSSSGKYVESPFKTHESIKEEFLKDFKLYAKSYRYDFDKSDPLNIHNALNDEASKLVDLTVGENTEKISIAEAFILRETNPKKFVKWSWLYDLIKTEAEEELSNEAIIKNICSFLLDGNTDLEPNVFEGVDFSNYYGEYYEDIPRDDFLNNVDTEIPSFTINFDLAGGEWIDIDSVVNEYQEGTVVELIEPVKNGYNFLGWYDENDNQVTELTVPDKNVSLEAKWETIVYEISYDIGESKLNSYNETINKIINDFLDDYNSYTTSAMSNKGTNHNATSFFDSIDQKENSKPALFLLSKTYYKKWEWLVRCIVTVANPSNYYKNKNAWSRLPDYYYKADGSYLGKGTYSSPYNAYLGPDLVYINDVECIRAELRGFIAQKQYTKKTNFTSADYNSSSIQDKIWTYIQENKSVAEISKYIINYELENDTYTIESEEFILNEISKDGYIFKGWFIGDEKIISIPTGTFGDIVLTAKFEKCFNSFNIEKYDNSGGKDGDNITYFCDISVMPGNNLRWQYKILLKYDEEKDAYLVVAVDSATASADNAAGKGNWTHAISNVTDKSVVSEASVGQYIVFSEKPQLGDIDFTAYVYNADQIQ